MNKRLLTKQEALEMLEDVGCSHEVIRHCKTVSRIATKIAKICQNKGLNVDVDLVEIGALLHDIGRSKTHSVDHAIIGSEIVQSLGLPSSLASIVERHVGGGITLEEAERLGWPVKSYLPQTLEEKIVNHADKLVERTHVVPIGRTIKKLSEELGESHPAIERVRKLDGEMSHLTGDVRLVAAFQEKSIGRKCQISKPASPAPYRRKHR